MLSVKQSYNGVLYSLASQREICKSQPAHPMAPSAKPLTSFLFPLTLHHTLLLMMAATDQSHVSFQYHTCMHVGGQHCQATRRPVQAAPTGCSRYTKQVMGSRATLQCNILRYPFLRLTEIAYHYNLCYQHNLSLGCKWGH